LLFPEPSDPDCCLGRFQLKQMSPKHCLSPVYL
jgi:hypothetical protein